MSVNKRVFLKGFCSFGITAILMSGSALAQNITPEFITPENTVNDFSENKKIDTQEQTNTEDTNKNITELDAVTVMATRSEKDVFDVAGMANVINFDDAAVKSASTIQDIFKQTPFVQFDGSARRNGQNPTLRGFDDESIVILFDGVRQNFESQHDGTFFIDPSLLKKVEVVRGPSSALYGSGGMGGVIAFETKDAVDMLKDGETKGASISTGYESVNNEKNSTASAYGISNDGRWDAVSSFTFRDSGDVRLGDGTDLPADDNVLSGMAKLNFIANDSNEFGASLQHYLNNATEPNNPALNLTGDGIVDKVSESSKLAISHKYDDFDNDYLKLNTKVYYNTTGVEETIIDPPLLTTINQPGDVLDREMDTYGINLDANTNLKEDGYKNIFAYGGEYYTNDQNGSDSRNGERGGVPDAESSYYGLYLQDEFGVDSENVKDAFTITPAVRYDNYESSSAAGLSNEDNAISPKLALSYKPKDWFMMFGNYSEAFRAPNLTEIYTTGVHFNIGPIQNNFVPNPNLRPEKIASTEFGAGVDFDNIFDNTDNFKFKVTRFDIDGEDFIDQQVDIINNITTSVNVPNAKLHGAEIEAGYENKRVALNWGYTTITGKNSDTGAYLGSIMPRSLVQNVSLKLPEVDGNLGLRTTAVDEHKNVNNLVDARSGYVLHDVYYNWNALDNLEFNAGVDNIFDKKYARVFAGSIEPGRNYKVQGKYNW